MTSALTIGIAGIGACVAGALGILPGAQGTTRTPLSSESGEDSAWLAGVSAGIHAAEYHYSEVLGERGVWSAPNRGRDLRSRVSPAGLEVFPRESGADGAGTAWKLRLTTRSFGRRGCVEELPPGLVSTSDARAEIARGALTEWFENRPDGIEQGWTIAAPPPGSREDALWIGLEVEGLSVRIDAGNRSAELADGQGERRLRYRDLAAFDATGCELDARLLSDSTGVSIRVDDRSAVYPVRVDPLLTGPVWTAEGNRAFAYFGWSVASAGDVNGDGYGDVVVGAQQYDNGQSAEGRAYLYLGSASGLATSAAWTAEGDQAGAFFGNSVASGGDVNGDGYGDVLVGAQGGGPTGDGRASLYLGSPLGLATSPAWTANGEPVGATLGYAVASAGDVNGDGYGDVIVGDPLYPNGGFDAGRVTVYLGSASGLAASAAWTMESGADPGNGEWFGHSVASAGDVNGDGYGDVIVGALLYDTVEYNEGRAFLYLGSASGLATSPVWTAVGDQYDERFGASVSSAGDVNGDGYGDVIVGAYFYDNAQSGEGAAFLFLGSASGPSPSADWIAESDQEGAEFGTSVSGAGDLNGDGYGDVVVGAPTYQDGQFFEGRVFVYFGSSQGLSTSAGWTAESDQDSAIFGVSASGAGDVNGDGYSDVIVGAFRYDNGQTDEGGAFVYHGAPGTLALTPAWSAESDTGGGQLGLSVSSAGDVNGDGYGDVIVGALSFDSGFTNEGKVYLYPGSPSGLSAVASWEASSGQASARFGSSVSGAGDVNGDGYDDVVVGAPYYANGQVNEGRAYVFLGSAGGLAPSASWIAESNQAAAFFGLSVAGVGDMNGDGFAEVIVGAPGYDNDQPNEGRAFVYQGSAQGLAQSPAWTAESNQPGSYFGFRVAAAGDVDGDGFSDALVGAPLHDNGQVNEGRVFVYAGSSSGFSTGASWTAEGNQEMAFFGSSVASAGDVNGDGFADVIVGAPSLSENGQAYVYHGSAGGLSASAAWIGHEQQGFEISLFGTSVASAGDVNGDGYAEVIVGAPGYEGEGRAFVYSGSASGLSTSPYWSAGAGQAAANFGISVSAAGDVTGDGYGDVIVGADGYDNASSFEVGRAFVYYGNEAGGPTVRPRQRRVSGGPMAILDRSDDRGAFWLSLEFDRDLSAFAWAKPGGTSARLQWEVARLGASFDGLPDGQSAPQTVSGATLVFDEIVGGLEPGTPYTWRARIATDNPLFPNTPWFTAQGKAVTETKFRTRDSKAWHWNGSPGSGSRSVP